MTNCNYHLKLFHAWSLKHSSYKMRHHCVIADVNASFASKVMTQEKIIVKSDLSLTKHDTKHFLCTCTPSDENNKSHVDETKFKEIKIKITCSQILQNLKEEKGL